MFGAHSLTCVRACVESIQVNMPASGTIAGKHRYEEIKLTHLPPSTTPQTPLPPVLDEEAGEGRSGNIKYLRPYFITYFFTGLGGSLNTGSIGGVGWGKMGGSRTRKSMWSSSSAIFLRFILQGLAAWPRYSLPPICYMDIIPWLPWIRYWTLPALLKWTHNSVLILFPTHTVTINSTVADPTEQCFCEYKRWKSDNDFIYHEYLDPLLLFFVDKSVFLLPLR